MRGIWFGYGLEVEFDWRQWMVGFNVYSPERLGENEPSWYWNLFIGPVRIGRGLAV